MIARRVRRAIVNQVWERAQAVAGEDPALWRRDDGGSLIYRPEYGDVTACFGWVIDRVCSGMDGEPDAPANLVARHWHHAASLQKEAGQAA